jgi:hypothetical protein
MRISTTWNNTWNKHHLHETNPHCILTRSSNTSPEPGCSPVVQAGRGRVRKVASTQAIQAHKEHVTSLQEQMRALELQYHQVSTRPHRGTGPPAVAGQEGRAMGNRSRSDSGQRGTEGRAAPLGSSTGTGVASRSGPLAPVHPRGHGSDERIPRPDGNVCLQSLDDMCRIGSVQAMRQSDENAPPRWGGASGGPPPGALLGAFQRAAAASYHSEPSGGCGAADRDALASSDVSCLSSSYGTAAGSGRGAGISGHLAAELAILQVRAGITIDDRVTSAVGHTIDDRTTSAAELAILQVRASPQGPYTAGSRPRSTGACESPGTVHCWLPPTIDRCVRVPRDRTLQAPAHGRQVRASPQGHLPLITAGALQRGRHMDGLLVSGPAKSVEQSTNNNESQGPYTGSSYAMLPHTGSLPRSSYVLLT